ncbi:MAG: glycosyltransferase, partial [Candidatus Omnitrophica bacterium]|nr:glycosyltransferase [Candidatus Omnitrophota bacterium]
TAEQCRRAASAALAGKTRRDSSGRISPVFWRMGAHDPTDDAYQAGTRPAPTEYIRFAMIALVQLIVFIPTIALWLKRHKIKLVHLNNEILSHLPLILGARLAGCRIICHFHGWRKLTRTEKVISRVIHCFISVTQSGADFYSWQLDGMEVVGIPNGLLMSERSNVQPQVRIETRQKLGFIDQDFVVLIVGRFIPLKGHSVFLKAIAAAVRVNQNLKALVVGTDPSPGGEFRRKLEHEVLQLNLKERVQFLSWQDHMGPVYEASDVVVQPSVEPESFGYAALEGMSMEKPVIASRIGGLVDVVGHGETGFLIEPGDSDQLAEAVLNIAENLKLAIQLGKNGRQRVKRLFTMEHNAEEVQNVYRKILNAKRILIAESGSGYGGTAKYLFDLVTHLNRDEFSLEVVAYGGGPFIQKLKGARKCVSLKPSWFFPWGEDKTQRGDVQSVSFAGGKIGRAIVSLFQLIFLVPQIAVWLRKRRIALVHLNNDIRSHLPLLLAARITGARVICHFHGWRPMTRVEQWAKRWVDQFITLTDSGAGFLKSQLGGVSVQVIPNGISWASGIDDLEARRQEERKLLGIKSSEKVIAILGRLVPLKGHDTYLKALSEVIQKGHKVIGLVMGHDPSSDQRYLNALEAYASKLGIAGKMRFLPWQEDVASIYAASDIVIHASREAEPFPLVIIEAMLAGKPVIAAQLGGVVDLVRNGETGILFEPDDHTALAHSIETLMGDCAFVNGLTQNAKEWAQKSFRVEENALQIEQLYRRLLRSCVEAHGMPYDAEAVPAQNDLEREVNYAFKKAFYYTGGVAVLRNVLSTKVPILMYHRVFRKPDPFFPAVSEDTFRQQMEYLKYAYHVISLDELLKFWRLDQPVPRRSLVLTFDDTDVKTWSLIYPLCKTLGLPATIFLASGPAEEDSFIWTDRLRWWFKLTKLKRYAFQLNGHKKEWDLQDPENRLIALSELSGELKTWENINRKRAVAQLEYELGVRRSELPIDWILSQVQVRSADRNLISYGAHTVTHSILNRMTLEEARYEIYESKKRLEEIWGERVMHFAYPNGEKDDFGGDHKELITGAGFVSASSAILGLNDANTDRYALRRIYAREEPLANFACRLVGVGS